MATTAEQLAALTEQVSHLADSVSTLAAALLITDGPAAEARRAAERAARSAGRGRLRAVDSGGGDQ
jgi:hypothetical protein